MGNEPIREDDPLAALASFAPGAIENPNHQIVLQAAALAVQDSVSHLRSMEALATAVTGVALNGMIRTADVKESGHYLQAMYGASMAVEKACKNFAEVSKVADSIIHGKHHWLPPVVRETETETVTSIDDKGDEVRIERTIRRVRRES